MSRCFPFPPPGYEKKPRPGDSNLLIKEKHREKKHKKEKKDKARKERKEKKDKERSREKKEKKNKHKDKKDREKDKDKKRTSEEKKVLGAPEDQNGGSSCSTVIQGSESKKTFLLESEKRLRNDDASTESKIAEIISAEHSSFRFQGMVMEKNAFDVLSNGKDKFKENREDLRRANGHILKVARGMENGVHPNVKGENRKQIEGGLFLVEKVNENCIEVKDKKSHKHIDAKGDRHQDRDQTKKSKPVGRKGEKEKKEQNAIEEKSELQIKKSCIGSSDHGNELLYLPTKNTRIKGNLGKRNEPEPNKGNLGKRKEPEPNKGLHDDISRPIKLSRPVSSSSHTVQNASKHDPLKTTVRLGLERHIMVQDHQVDSEVSSSLSYSQNTRKTPPGCTLDGFTSVTKITINNHKVVNGPLPSRPGAETGLKVEPCQADMNSTVLGPGLVSNHKLATSREDVEKRSRSNGDQASIHTTAERQGILELKMDGKKHAVNSVVKSDESKKVKKEYKIHKRPAHPDTKYLSQILTVPQVEWSDIDDQEWLFSSSAKKPRIVLSKVDETVWAEALQIESADVVALPYVLPY